MLDTGVTIHYKIAWLPLRRRALARSEACESAADSTADLWFAPIQHRFHIHSRSQSLRAKVPALDRHCSRLVGDCNSIFGGARYQRIMDC